MTKPIITQEQADAIESLADNKKGLAVDFHVKAIWENEHGVLNDLSTDQLIKALYIGYEVELEYLRGDWVNFYFGGRHYIGKILGTYTSGMFEVLSTELTSSKKVDRKDVSRATETEIAQEKERRTEKKLSEMLNDLTVEEKQRLRQILNS